MKIGKRFYSSIIAFALLILLPTSAIKLYEAFFVQNTLLDQKDNVLVFLNVRALFMLTGVLEIAIAVFLLLPRTLLSKMLLLNWFSLLLVFYRYINTGGSYFVTSNCGCAGKVTLGAWMESVEKILSFAVVALLISSLVATMELWRNERRREDSEEVAAV